LPKAAAAGKKKEKRKKNSYPLCPCEVILRENRHS
jgi:hypothetical protein